MLLVRGEQSAWAQIFAAASLAGALFFCAPQALAEESPKPTKVQDLYYGEVLFHFYQRDHFTAHVR